MQSDRFIVTATREVEIDRDRVANYMESVMDPDEFSELRAIDPETHEVVWSLDDLDGDGSETSFDTKRAIMRAEHGDEIHVETLGVCEVIQRVNTYYGPKLRVEAAGDDRSDQYLVHAICPDSEAQLRDTHGDPLREVAVELVGTKQYDICLQCGEPLASAEHRRRAAIGACVVGGETDA